RAAAGGRLADAFRLPSGSGGRDAAVRASGRVAGRPAAAVRSAAARPRRGDGPACGVARLRPRAGAAAGISGTIRRGNGARMTTALTLLIAQGVLGALDTLIYHELWAHLPGTPAARRELRLHAARDFA